MTVISPVHLLFIAVVALIFLGPKRLPELAKSLGKGMREFREALSAGEGEEEPAEAPPPIAPLTPPEPPPATVAAPSSEPPPSA